MSFDHFLGRGANSPNGEFCAIAGADLSAKQYHVVALDSSFQAQLVNASTYIAVCGILQNAPALGEMAQIRITGFSRVKVSGAVSAQGWVVVDGVNPGQVKAVSAFHSHTGNNQPPNVSSLNLVVGIVLEAASAGGTPVCRLMPQVF